MTVISLFSWQKCPLQNFFSMAVDAFTESRKIHSKNRMRKKNTINWAKENSVGIVPSKLASEALLQIMKTEVVA